MPRRNPHRPFTPDPDQMALHPGVDGNAVNGLGEDMPRRPRIVYWAPDPADIPHGQMQLYFYKQSSGDPDFAANRAARQKILDAPLPDVAPVQATCSAGDWAQGLDRFVTNGQCEMVGVAKVQPDWIFEGYDIALPRVVVLGVQHSYENIQAAPAPKAGMEVLQQYGRAAAVSKSVTGWIRDQGWQAEPVTGPMTGALALIPAALACGFGELGKHGSIINPELGASFRLSAVLTDAPFALTPPRDFGIDDFCASCRVCEDACPPEALFSEKQTVRGVEKWYVDFEKCLPFFNQTNGCAICIAVCPWSRPGVGMNLAAKLARRADRLEAE